MSNPTRTLSYATCFKIALLWTPIALWYLIGFIATKDPHFFAQVDTIYYDAANHWLNQQMVYHCKGNGCFVYLPTSAILFTPLAILPVKLAELIFRLLSMSLLTVGIYTFCRDIATTDLKRTFFIALLTTVVLSQAPVFVGQLHLIITGLMLWGFSLIAREKWWSAAIVLALSFAIKPTSIVLCLLAASLYPRVALKLLCTLVFIFLASFLTQSPHYVASQYIAFIHEFRYEMHFDAYHGGHWATLFGAIAFYSHIIINGTLQFSIRIIAAGIVFLLGLFATRTLSKKEAIYFIVACGMTYLMLFNSRTENNDYIMVMPLVGYSLARCIEEKKSILIGCFCAGIALMMANWNLSKIISPGNNVWINPTVIVFYGIYLLYELKATLV